MLYIDDMFSYFRGLLTRRKTMIVAIGDTHGKITSMSEKIQSLNLEKGTQFVHVGDFGLGFDSPIKEYKKLRDLNFVLSMNDQRLWVIRGNHDNPVYWEERNSFELSNIKFVPDNTFMELDGRMCFFAGGALSIDRTSRQKGATYWPGETYEWKEPKDVPGRVDHIFTHDVYHQCSPFNIDSPSTEKWFPLDPNLRGDMIESQMHMKSLYDFFTSINDDFSWYHGHYHESHFTSIGKQKTYGLSIMEFKEVY
jgi:predicted phosphodiesterase